MNLKKRYLKKKSTLKKLQRSGAGLRDVTKSENELHQYDFLQWIDNFIRQRTAKSNLPSSDVDEDSIDLNSERDEINEDYDFSDNEEEDADEERVERLQKKHQQSIPIKEKPKIASSKSNVAPSKLKKHPGEMADMQLALMKSIQKDMEFEKKEKKEDDIDLFVKSLGAELRKLDEIDICLAKHELSNTIFKFQMSKMNAAYNQQGQSHFPFAARNTQVPAPSASGFVSSGYNFQSSLSSRSNTNFPQPQYFSTPRQAAQARSMMTPTSEHDSQLVNAADAVSPTFNPPKNTQAHSYLSELS